MSGRLFRRPRADKPHLYFAGAIWLVEMPNGAIYYAGGTFRSAVIWVRYATQPDIKRAVIVLARAERLA